LAGIPANNGMAGFAAPARIAALLCGTGAPIITRISLKMERTIDPQDLALDQARKIMAIVEGSLNYDNLTTQDLRSASLSLISVDRDSKPRKLILWTSGDVDLLGRLLPKKIWGMPVILRQVAPGRSSDMLPFQEFEDEPTKVEPEARMSGSLFMR